MKNKPSKIFLQIGDGYMDDADFKELSEVTWCEDKIFDTDIEYELKKPDESEEGNDAIEFAEYFHNNFDYYDCNANGRAYKWIDLSKRNQSAMTMKQIFDYWKSRSKSESQSKKEVNEDEPSNMHNVYRDRFIENL